VRHNREMEIDVKKHVHRLNLKSSSSSSLYKQSGGLRNQLDACSLPREAACLAAVLISISRICVSYHITTELKTRLLLVNRR
jgi:hypothetical protein